MPVLLLSITEKPYHEKLLLKYPSLYREIAGNKRLAWKNFIGWISLSIYHSYIVYLFGYMMFYTNSIEVNDLVSFGTLMIHNVVLVVTIRLWLIARYQTIIFTISIVVSVAAFTISTVLYDCFLIFSTSMFFVYNHLIYLPEFWVSNILICIVALLPDYVMLALKSTISNGWNHVLRNHRNNFKTNTNSISESTSL